MALTRPNALPFNLRNTRHTGGISASILQEHQGLEGSTFPMQSRSKDRIRFNSKVAETLPLSGSGVMYNFQSMSDSS